MVDKVDLENWKWPQNRWLKIEFACPHGVGHGRGVHACEGCCAHESYKREVVDVKRDITGDKRTI